MAKIEISTTLAAPAETVWHHLQYSAVMAYVAYPRLRFRPIDPPALPERWTEGQYRVAVYGFGMFPFGTQVLGVSFPHVDPPRHVLRDDGQSTFFCRWSHQITVEPVDPDTTRYTDTVEVTPRIPGFAFTGLLQDFFRHRQRRWQTLVENSFDTAL